MKFPYKATIIVLICVCLLLGIYSFFDQVLGGVKKQIAVSGSIEDIVRTKGFIMRDEMVIADNSGSVIDSMVTDGERVSKGQQVAYSYSSSVNSDVKAELKSLNERIMNLENNVAQNRVLGNDSVKSEALVKSKMNEIIKYSHLGQAIYLSEIKSELETVIDKKLSDDKSESVLENLKNRKNELEEGIAGEKNAIYAPESGMYFSFLDGGEKVLLPEKIIGMTVKEFNNIDKSVFDQKSYTGAKVARDFKWYYVTVVDAKKSMAMKEGSKVKLRFTGNGDKEAEAVIYYISEEEKSKAVVAFELTTFSEYAYNNRFVDADIILSHVSGLKFLKDAVHVEDSVTGVYIVDDSVAKFRQVEILGSDDKYVVVKNNITEYKSVALYDEIVIKGDVENNKIVK